MAAQTPPEWVLTRLAKEREALARIARSEKALMLSNSGQRWTAARLAEELGVTPSAVRKDITLAKWRRKLGPPEL